MTHRFHFYTKKAVRLLKAYLPFMIGIGLFFLGGVALWASTLRLPDLSSPENIKITESTKVFDRTGNVVLFDLNGEMRRTAIDGAEMSPYIRLAAVAIEDEDFYTHGGIKISAIIRSVIANVLSLEYSQGGSTITQQVIKNALLTQEKTITRKIKEWILALKLEKIMSKEDILTLYLNTSPYGGNMYGIEEASSVFFGKKAKDLNLAEAAYMAALPQAPTYFSPYGSHKDRLEARKDLVLRQMLKNGFIKQDEYEAAKATVVTFSPSRENGIKAPHFVMFVREQLEEMFSEEELREGGLKIITTLDYELEAKAEEITKKYALQNEKNNNAENAALVAIDPANGDILAMVGSRDYFDKDIDGNYNIATAMRQPGSSFKPIVYAKALSLGYRPETILFDVPTEFSTTCASGGVCYRPENYDNKYRGPINLRNALAQSVNIPAVQVLYLVGIKSALALAGDMGITSLGDASRYGLSLVLGGGEVKLLDMVSAYGIFATEGMRSPYRSILKVEDRKGKILYESKPSSERVLDAQVALQISDILSDEQARIPSFGANSPLYFPNRTVAVKTGTTNDYRDAWIIGYTNNIAVGAWAGNNDNSSMEKKVAGFIIAPMWNEFMDFVLSKKSAQSFPLPAEQSPEVKPIIRGDYMTGGIHSILHWVDTTNPLGDAPRNPARDPQYNLWESAVQNWLHSTSSGMFGNITDGLEAPASTTPLMAPIQIISPYRNNPYDENIQIPVVLSLPAGYTPSRADVFINNKLVGSFSKNPFTFSFVPKDVRAREGENEIEVAVYDASGKRTKIESEFEVKERDN